MLRKLLIATVWYEVNGGTLTNKQSELSNLIKAFHSSFIHFDDFALISVQILPKCLQRNLNTAIHLRLLQHSTLQAMK